MPIEIGGKNLFADEAAGFYGSLGFEVKRRHSLNGTTIDLFIRKRSAGLLTQAAVECLDSHPARDERSRIIAHHHNISERLPGLQQIIVTAHRLTDEAQREFKEAGIDYITFADLIYDSVPLDRYAGSLIADYERWRDEHWRGEDWFVRPDVVADGAVGRRSAIESIDQWLGNPGANLLIVLGDVGTGKSTLTRFLAYEMAKAFLSDPLKHPAPLLIPLGEVRQTVSWESILADHFRKLGFHNPGISPLDYLAQRGRIVALFDAFDEMADQVRPDVMKSNFRELICPVKQGWKVLFTCRTQYFRDRQEQVRLFGEESGRSEDDVAFEGELRSHSGIEVASLREFTDRQVRAYLTQARPETAGEDWLKIEAVYKLRELAQQPLLLEIIVKNFSELEPAENINAAKLYSLYMNSLIEHEKQKSRLLDRQIILGMMEEQAWQMWVGERNTIRYSDLVPFIEKLIEQKSLSLSDEGVLDIARDMAASFLKKDAAGTLSFVHDSVREYFLAQKLHGILKHADLDGPDSVKTMLKTRPFDRKVILFLTMLAEERTYWPLQLILQERYLPGVSENALHILYWSARIRCGMEEQVSDLEKLRAEMVATIPPRAQLAGANLRRARFEAVDLTEANLQRADLREANFNYAQLQDVDFRDANLPGASFNTANLARSNFLGAKGFEQSDFTGANLTNVSGLSVL